MSDMYGGYNMPITAFLADRKAQIDRAIKFAEENRRVDKQNGNT